ncbi:MAG: hypothetical protein ABFR62_01015 [Bacteroidota bacterium]
MKKIFLLFAIFTLAISCNKDEEEEPLSPAEQALADDAEIVEYMKTHKIVFLDGVWQNNIDWKVEEILEDDPEGTESLFDIMGANVIENVKNGINYKMYYHFVEQGGSSDFVEETDEFHADYTVSYLSGSILETTGSKLDATKFTYDTESLYKGWQLILEILHTGTLPNATPPSLPDTYRSIVEKPGRAIILIPSGLAIGDAGDVTQTSRMPLHFDMVIYNKTTVETVEE